MGDGNAQLLPRSRAFTLVELLVVIGIITVLISMLLPALSRARRQSNQVVCMSNLRQIGQAMLIYADGHDGWLYPPDMGFDPQHVNPFVPDVNAQDPGVGSPTDPPDSAATVPPGVEHNVWTIEVFNNVWNPPIMICPSDLNPKQSHSYVLNNYLHAWNVKYGTHIPGKSPSDVILMGEKNTGIGDFYMDIGDFDRVVDIARHDLGGGAGITDLLSSNRLQTMHVGSNYLMLDMHVDTQLIRNDSTAESELDPWDFEQGITPPQDTPGQSGQIGN